MAFDGANVWVTNFSSDSLTKLRASDGANLGTFPVGSGRRRGLRWCQRVGDELWLSNSVTKLRASDGANLGTFPVGSFPPGVAFDGANVWVANGGSVSGGVSGSVTKLRASNGVNLGTFPVGSSAGGVAFDGANVWVTDPNDANVVKLRASDGQSLGTFPAGVALASWPSMAPTFG